MGYSEIYCHICGVSFNIARRRKPGEPDLASWDYTGEQCDEPGVDEVDLDNCTQNGCFAAISYPKDDEHDMLDDPDYVPGPEDGDYGEPGEYDSEYESSTSEEDDANIGPDQDSNEETSDPEVDCYSNWLAKTLNPHARFSGEPIGKFGYSNQRCRDERVFPIQSTTLSDGHDPEELEHIPSRTCTEANAYSGFAISLEEMRGCRTAQCLIHKSAIREPSSQIEFSEPWEVSEDWLLSGLCDGMPSRDCNNPYVWPARGGVDQPRAENINFDPEWTTPKELAMPFHPWCFDIFCRQSKARFNCVNIPGLIKWRDAEFSYEAFHGFPRSGDVLEGQEQFWQHVPGKEYLAANPLYVPGLRDILQNADRMEEYELPKKRPTLLQAGYNDVFASLPPEIRLLVVRFLDASDLHNLRVASKAFASLPNSVWRQLVREEMPWLWESCYDSEEAHVPSLWTTVTANELMLFKEERERYLAQLKDSTAVDFLLPFPGKVPNQLKLQEGSLNWHAVYTQIKQNWSNLRGLRNRRRIWEDVEEIINRIEKYDTEMSG
ncbi:uncharacterized protein N7496_003487 [Penicillium cataractarum]|uniref:F-box domain-containing protein n=1 Tax=Penicillium cataractarum TaxID=2100454 RepID=A0A9W9SNP1_9EURO|nr:uncharacterized protein N7496_003487 [Penicillium cataractarum]KAJ5381059.1 hypothetical protein N7496_003487 [Penicillium cataractarum]